MEDVIKYITKKYPDIKRDAITGEIINVPDIDTMFIELKLNKKKVTRYQLLSYYNSTYIDEFDPIKEYFENLKLNGTGHIEELFAHLNIVGTPIEKEFYYTMFKKHLIGCVGQGLGEIVHRQILIIQGQQQHTGKTFFIRFLYPKELKKYTIETIGTDEHLILTHFWIINIDELDMFTKNDIDKIKRLVSTDTFSYRKFHTQTFLRKQRRGAFFGSTNKTEFLKDSENTRWITIPIESINFDYSKKININDVWAEAYHLYKNKALYTLTPDECDELNRLGDQYKYLTDYDHYVREYAIESETTTATATEFSEFVYLLLGIARPSPGHMGRALTKNGIEKAGQRKYKIRVKLYNESYTVKDAIDKLKMEKENV